MKRFLVFLLVIAMTVMIFVSCAAPEPSPSPTPTPKATPEQTPIPTTEPVPTPTPRPEDMSYTTGLQYKGEYKPVMVVIENSPAARPQTGLQTADVVYEVPVDGGVTRFVCVFSDNVPEGVMPVRSGRVSFLYIQQEWNTPFMHFGGSGSGNSNAPDFTFYGNKLHGDIKIDVDGLKGKWSDYYYRVKGIGAPHNVMGNPLEVQKLYDYTPTPLKWEFDSNVTYPGADVTEIKLGMSTKYDDFTSYTYDAAQDVYLRFMKGKEFKSKETDKQVAVKNIIVQYSTYEQIDVYKVWKMTGSGNADFYIGGKLVKGTWSKESPTSQTLYCDDKGAPIVLHPGNTWIHLDTEG